MQIGRVLSSLDICASGMAAERQRMEVVANNIANANSTRTPQGGPYRRLEMVFASALDSAQGLSVRARTACTAWKSRTSSPTCPSCRESTNPGIPMPTRRAG